MFMHILNQIRFHLYQYSFFSDDIYYNIVREKGHQQDALFDNSKFLSKIFFSQPTPKYMYIFPVIVIFSLLETLPILLAFSTIVNVLLGCCHCRKRLMKLTACVLQGRKQQP